LSNVELNGHKTTSNTSLLSELGSRTPRFGTYTTNELSPIHNQVASPTRSIVLPETNPSTLPRLDTSGNNEVTVTGMDLLDAQGVTASSTSVVGTHIPAPSPRRSTQSPANAHIVARAAIWKTNVGERRMDCLRVAPMVKP